MRCKLATKTWSMTKKRFLFLFGTFTGSEGDFLYAYLGSYQFFFYNDDVKERLSEDIENWGSRNFSRISFHWPWSVTECWCGVMGEVLPTVS